MIKKMGNSDPIKTEENKDINSNEKRDESSSNKINNNDNMSTTPISKIIDIDNNIDNISNINNNISNILETINDYNKEEDNDIIDERKYIWIDPDIYNDLNIYYYNYLTTNKKIFINRFVKVEEAFDYLIKKDNEFKEVVIIISAKLFQAFYQLFRRNIKSIKISPSILIFTSKLDLTINQLKMNNTYYNNDLFDSRLIFTNAGRILDYLNDTRIEEPDLTFDIIETLEQLVVPNYYSYLLEDVNKSEINYFNDYLIKNFLCFEFDEIKSENEDEMIKIGNKEIHRLVNQIKYKVLPKEILIKYWLRIYTLQSEFFKVLNKSLRYNNNQAAFYYPFIKLCYEGIRKGYLTPYTKKIYRRSQIEKEEFKLISDKYNSDKNNIFPSLIVFSRSFLSFSTEKQVAKGFKGFNRNTFSILYIIEEIKDLKNRISNASIEEYSNIPNEKEILVFPFTCFEIINIKEKNEEEIDFEIYLKYLGNYSQYIEEQLGQDFYDKIQISNFYEELIDCGILKVKNFFAIWKKKKKLEIGLDKIYFLLDGDEDLVGSINNDIIVYNIHTSKIKQTIKIHKNEIINIIKLPRNKICSSSKDNTIKVIELTDNNEHFVNVKNINALAKHFIYIEKDDNLLILDEQSKAFRKFVIVNTWPNVYNKCFNEEDKVLLMKKIKDNTIVYITENNKGNKKIKFINIFDQKKEDIQIDIKEDKNEKLKLIDILFFQGYILIAFNKRIDIIDYNNNIKSFDKTIKITDTNNNIKSFNIKIDIIDSKIKNNIKSFKFFDYDITNIFILSSNKIILGFYDSLKKSSIIRENLLRIEDIKKGKDKFDCIGQGKMEDFNMENIIKINQAQILINVKNNFCVIYERKNEFSEMLKEDLIENGLIKEENIININNKKEEEEEKIPNINNEKISLNNKNTVKSSEVISAAPIYALNNNNLINNNNITNVIINNNIYNNLEEVNNNSNISLPEANKNTLVSNNNDNNVKNINNNKKIVYN